MNSSSSSSSVGATARCGLWPVEQYLSIGHHELKKNNRDENKWKLLCSPN
jgi:hypothetical protein